MNTNEITPVQIAIRIVIIIVVIAIILMASFAMVRLVPKVISSLGGIKNIFAKKERMIVSLADTTIDQGDSTTLSYRQTGGTDNGTYLFNYSCAHIDADTRIEVASGNASQIVTCDRPITLGAATTTLSEPQTITVRPITEDVTFDQKVDMTVSHITTASATASMASAVLNIRGNAKGTNTSVTPAKNNDTKAKATSTQTIKTPTTTRPTTSVTAPARLMVRMGQVTMAPNGFVTATFYVTNTGGRPSGAWSFSAFLPRSVGQTSYTSPLQPSIPPQGTSTMYLSFANAQAGSIIVNVNGQRATATLK